MEEYQDKLLKQINNPVPSQKIEIEGKGTIEIYGDWNIEKIIKRLLESESITG
jgi:hypothetical protein